MKKIILLGSVTILFFSLACNEKSIEPFDSLPAKPIVKKSSLVYNKDTFNALFPHTESLNSISNAYSNNYSEDLKEKILGYMKNEVAKLGEDISIFDTVLTRTSCKITGEYILPTYAERAKFENHEVWIFQVTYGLGVPNFGHFRCFALSIKSLDTLAYKGCK